MQESASVKARWIIGTRTSQGDFFTTTATGKFLRAYRSSAGEHDVRVFANNGCGLPEIYNLAIEESKDDPALMIFAHDDLHVADFHWHLRLAEALQSFQIVGIAGNTRRISGQSAWWLDEQMRPASQYLSGVIAHGKGYPPSHFDVLGPVPAQVKQLDGLLLACHSKTLIDTGLRFDERFDFHFYDLDFCRQADLLGITMGTCALTIVHESVGNLASEDWRQGRALYMDKWKD